MLSFILDVVVAWLVVRPERGSGASSWPCLETNLPMLRRRRGRGRRLRKSGSKELGVVVWDGEKRPEPGARQMCQFW